MPTRTNPSRAKTPASTTTDTALVAFFAALIAVCAIVPGIHPFGLVVPITLQTFGVLLSGGVLGARRGFLAVLLYLVVGFAGLPIFADRTGGLGVLAKPSVGYLLAFPLAAALTGFIVERLPREKLAVNAPLIFLAGMAGSIVFIHSFGIVGLAAKIPGVDLRGAMRIDWLYWPGDLIKNACMAVVASAVHRAFPDILPRRR